MESDRNPVAPPRRKKKSCVVSDNESSPRGGGSNIKIALNPSISSIECGIDAVKDGEPSNSGSKDDISSSKFAETRARSTMHQLPPRSPRSAKRLILQDNSRVNSERPLSKENVYLETTVHTKDPSMSSSLVSSPVSKGNESPKQKPARPERPKLAAVPSGTPKHPSLKSSSSSISLKSAYSANKRGDRVAKKEGELTIIDSIGKEIVRKGSKSDEDGDNVAVSPTKSSRRPLTTTRQSSVKETTTTRQSSVKEWMARGKQETSIAALEMRNKAQLLIKKVKSSTLPRFSSSSSGHSKVTHRLPERPPRPAPPKVDEPVYATIGNETRSTCRASSISNYSYVDTSKGWWKKGGGQDKAERQWAILPASSSEQSSSLYTQLTPNTIDDEGAYEEMQSFTQSYTSSLSATSSLSLSDSRLNPESPVTTAKHLLSTEHNLQGEDDGDYMFMSSLTMDEPSHYMGFNSHPSSHQPEDSCDP